MCNLPNGGVLTGKTHQFSCRSGHETKQEQIVRHTGQISGNAPWEYYECTHPGCGETVYWGAEVTIFPEKEAGE